MRENGCVLCGKRKEKEEKKSYSWQKSSAPLSLYIKYQCVPCILSSNKIMKEEEHDNVMYNMKSQYSQKIMSPYYYHIIYVSISLSISFHHPSESKERGTISMSKKDI